MKRPLAAYACLSRTSPTSPSPARTPHARRRGSGSAARERSSRARLPHGANGGSPGRSCCWLPSIASCAAPRARSASSAAATAHEGGRAAAAAGIPWLAIRAIVDPLRSSLPAFTRDPTAGYVGHAIKYALSGPRAAAELVRLATRARAAAAALEVALHRLRPMLGATEARA